jgi:hypothetical protein
VERGWYAPGSHVNPAINGAAWANNGLFLVPTYLGAFESGDKNTTCNGIIYPVTPEQYAAQVGPYTVSSMMRVRVIVTMMVMTSQSQD